MQDRGNFLTRYVNIAYSLWGNVGTKTDGGTHHTRDPGHMIKQYWYFLALLR